MSYVRTIKNIKEWGSRCSTLPLKTAKLGESKKVAELLELDTCKRLRKYVGYHVFGWTVFERDCPSGNCLPDEMEMYVYVLCTSMECRIFQEVDGTLGVAIKIHERSELGEGV